MGKATDPVLPGLWQAYYADRSLANRARLMEAYYPYVRRISRGFTIASSGYFDRDDLVSAGVFGLANAIDRFDPTLKVSFETYSAIRIRGAMVDALRAADWAPRSLRRAARALANARQAGRAAGHEPTWAEMASQMKITDEAFTRLVGALDGTHVLSLDVKSVGETAEAGDALLLDAPDPSQVVVTTEASEMLHCEMGYLSDREQDILHDYYWDGESLAAIGRGLHLTESRISQIRTGAQATLKAQLTVAWRVA